MAREHLSRSPYHLNMDAHIYEDRSGLEVFSEGKRVGVIPWKKVRDALRRHDKPSKPAGGGKE